MPTQVITLGSIAEIVTGTTPDPSNPDFWGDAIPFVTPGDIDGGGTLQTTERSLSSEGAKRARVVPAGATLVTCIGSSVGKIALADALCATNQQINAVVPKSGYDPLYIFEALVARAPFIRRLAGVTAVPIVSKSELSKLPMPAPPSPNAQRVVGGSLGSHRNALNLLASQIAAKRRFKRGLALQLLTGKRRFREFQAQPWVRVRIGDVAKEVWRPVEWSDSELYRLVSVRRWGGGVYLRENVFGKEIKVKKLYAIRTGDLLVSHIQSAYGAFALVPAGFDGMNVSDLYSVLVPQSAECLDVRFLGHVCQTKRMWHLAYLASNGFFAERLRLNFSAGDFLKHTIEIPAAVNEQKAIVELLDGLDRELVLLEKLRERLDQQRRGVAELLLTGKIPVLA